MCESIIGTLFNLGCKNRQFQEALRLPTLCSGLMSADHQHTGSGPAKLLSRRKMTLPAMAAAKLLGSLELGFLLVGSGMLGGFVAGNLDRSMVSRAELQQFRAMHVSPTTHPSDLEPQLSVRFSLWPPPAIYQSALPDRWEAPLAVLRIGRVGLEAPVFEGTDQLILKRGVGHISGTALPGQDGNIAIAGHRDSFFRALKDIAVGDTIELEAEDRTYDYGVTQMLVVDPTEVAVLQPRAVPSLTLVTCYPFYFIGSAPKRYIVQAALDSVTSSTGNHSKSMQEISQ
jgi:sortase A